MFKIQIISLFPDAFDSILNHSILKRAQDKQLIDFNYINLRDFGIGSFKQVDDTPYGGGSGMLLKPEPLIEAISKAKQLDKSARVVLLSPRGRQYLQSEAVKLSKESGLILVCPKYEGYDERVTKYVDDVISIGNYVLSGGELPALVIIDTVARLIPGVLGNSESLTHESFNDDQTIEHPQYTRPEDYKGMKVPDVLLSGDHQKIADWRKLHKQ